MGAHEGVDGQAGDLAGEVPQGDVDRADDAPGDVAVELEHALALAGAGIVFVLRNGHAYAAGEKAHRVRVGEIFDLHDEIDDAAALAAAEAVVDLLVRRDGEGRRLFAVEGAESEQILSAFFRQSDILGNDVRDIVSFNELLNEAFGKRHGHRLLSVPGVT